MKTTNTKVYAYNKFKAYGNCLNISLNDITQNDITSLTAYLNDNQHITTIKIEYSSGNTDFKPLQEVLHHSQCVTTLNFNKCQATKVDITHLCKLLSINHSIQHLNLDLNMLDAESAEIIAHFLKENSSLKSLSLNENSISDDGVILITNAINTNFKCGLTLLSLQANTIGLAGFNALATMMQSNTSIIKLDILYNRINDDQCLHWMDIIEGEIKLNTLNDGSKVQEIVNMKKRLDILHNILLDPDFQTETGIRKGLIQINSWLNSCQPVLEKWKKLKEVTADRKGTLSSYFVPTYLGGRDPLTQQIYNIIENDLFDELDEMGKKYDVVKSFHFI
jgi:hypothetical protein